jgi:hypothetical protein
MLLTALWVLTAVLNSVGFFIFFGMQHATREGFPPEMGMPRVLLRPGRMQAFQLSLFGSWIASIWMSWSTLGIWKLLSICLLILFLSHFIARSVYRKLVP